MGDGLVKRIRVPDEALLAMEQLETIHCRLLETDLAIKTGQMDQVLALDMLVVGLSKGKTKG